MRSTTESVWNQLRREYDFATLAGRVEDWRGVPKVWPSLLLPVSVGSASIAEP